jgi:hypothetical protein
VLEELAVVARPVGAEVLQDGGEGRVGHGDLEEVVAEGDLWGGLVDILFVRWLEKGEE